MSASVLFICDDSPVPDEVANRFWDKKLPLRSGGGEINILIENVSHALNENLSPIATDLVRLAAFIYVADQRVSRGGEADVFGDDWRRALHLCVPVSDPDFWSTPIICEALTQVLGFATDDYWTFSFSAREPDYGQLRLQGTGVSLLHKPDSVLLFSGGMDSLCAAVEEVQHGRRPVLLSHRSTHVPDRRQQDLRNSLARAVGQWQYPHVQVWVHGKGGPATDYSQRTRGFLFASLGAAVADSIGLGRIVFADNGVVSLNLAINQQLIGAKSSKSTHPKFLGLMQSYLSLVLKPGIVLENPLWSRTRAECLQVLVSASVPELLRQTNSCAHWTRLNKDAPHCGTCSQCIDRRFASVSAGLEQFDPSIGYSKDAFLSPLDFMERALGVSYLAFARRVHELRSDEEAVRDLKGLNDCVLSADPDPDGKLLTLIAMLRRHSSQVLAVMAQKLEAALDDVVANTLQPNCLLSIHNTSVVTEPLVLRGLAVNLSPEERKAAHALGFRSELHVQINGQTSFKRRNLVIVGETPVYLNDADFVLLLRIMLGLWREDHGYQKILELSHLDGSDEDFMPSGSDQALSRLRRNFLTATGELGPKALIEQSRGRVRLSMHQRLITIEHSALVDHPDIRVRQLNAAIESARTHGSEYVDSLETV